MKDLDTIAREASALRVCSVLSARFNFAVAAAVMRSSGIPVGRNWSETEAKVRDLDDDSSSVFRSKTAVLASLVELSSVHDKRVTWIDYSRAPGGQVSAFDSWVRSVKAMGPRFWTDGVGGCVDHHLSAAFAGIASIEGGPSGRSPGHVVAHGQPDAHCGRSLLFAVPGRGARSAAFGLLRGDGGPFGGERPAPLPHGHDEWHWPTCRSVGG